ncbi:hypothetical protein D3C85_1848660 [compost metagenome]
MGGGWLAVVGHVRVFVNKTVRAQGWACVWYFKFARNAVGICGDLGEGIGRAASLLEQG